MYHELKCHSCGKRLLSYEKSGYKYGNPIRQCKRCGTEYIDPRFVEPAVSGFSQGELMLSPYIAMAVFGLFILFRGYRLSGMRMLNTADEVQWVMPTFLIAVGIIIFIVSIYELVLIRTGQKKKKLERLLEESTQRMSSKNYAAKLSSLGYPIPEQFFNGGRIK